MYCVILIVLYEKKLKHTQKKLVSSLLSQETPKDIILALQQALPYAVPLALF